MDKEQEKLREALKQYAKSLDASEARFHNIIEKSADGIIIVDKEGIVRFVNAAAEILFGHKKEELVGELFGFPVVANERTEIEIVSNGKEVHSAEMRVAETEWEGEASYLASIRDVTERKRAEEQLRNKEEQLRTILETVKEGITFSDEKGYFEVFNSEMEKLTGYSIEEANASGDFSTLIYPDLEDRKRVYNKLTEMIEKGITNESETTIRTKDGTERNILVSTILVLYKGRNMFLSAFRDITELRRDEKKIQQSYDIQSAISSILQISLEPISLEEQLKRILDLILAIPWLSLQSKGCIFLIEDEPDLLVMKAQRGLAEPLLTACKKVPFGRCLCGRAASTGEIQFTDHVDGHHETHYQGMLPHGHYNIPITSGGRIYGVINMYVKEGHIANKREIEFLSAVANTLAGIIERKKLEKKLIHSEKLSALGRLTANVAHEIRNPLTAVGGFARRLDKKISDETKEKGYCEVIISEVGRLEKILRNVLTFSGDIHLYRKNYPINDVVEESLTTYEAVCKEHSINIQKAYGDVPQILIDKEQVRETIDNFVSNAIDSMPDGGNLSVVTKEELLDKITYVTVRISDTGKGIPAKKLSTIFEPFFTTKAVGTTHGTGLGLSISRKIMEGHGGFIRAESVIGKGSTFVLYFPYQNE